MVCDSVTATLRRKQCPIWISHVRLGKRSYDTTVTFLKKSLGSYDSSSLSSRLKKIKMNQIQENTKDYSRVKKSSISLGVYKEH